MAGAQYDMIVVGGGPTGLVAAMFAARRGLSTLMLAKDIGGQLGLTDAIENYPGLPSASGRELVENLKGQAERDGARIELAEVIAMTPGGETHGVRTTDGRAFATRTIILAFGLTPNDLGVPGERELWGKGVYYSTVADAPPQQGKTVAVVGGGNSALTAALELAPKAQRVFLVHWRDEFRGERVLFDRVRALPNVELVTPYAVAAVHGTDRVARVALVRADGAATRDLEVESVFVQIGYSAKTKWLEGVVVLNARHEIVVDRDCVTSTPGIFAAGDITDIPYKQAVISAGEGAKAALQAFKYLALAVGKPAVMIDWDAKH